MVYSKNSYRLAIVAFVICLHSSVASANPLTPVFLAQGFHLLFGNAIIGVVEGLIIALIFKIPKKRSIRRMILANYASMIVGMVILAASEHLIFGDEPELYRLRLFPISFFLPMLVLAIVLEWPFCAWIMPSGKGRWLRGLKASSLVQPISYAFLVGFFILISTTPEDSGIAVDRSLVPDNKDPAMIYYIGIKDGDLYKINLNGTALQKLRTLGLRDYKKLFTAPNEERTGWTLYVEGEHYDSKPIVLIENFSKRPAVSGSVIEYGGDNWRSMHTYMGPAAELRPVDQRDWKVSVSIFADKALTAKNQKTGEVIILGIDTPFNMWMPKSATVLPGNKVVAEMGGNILLWDIDGRKLGHITRGRSPVVSWEGKMTDSWLPKDFVKADLSEEE